MTLWNIFSMSFILATSTSHKVIKWVYVTCGCQSITTLIIIITIIIIIL